MIGKFGVMHLFSIDYTKMSDFLFDSGAKNHIIEGYMKAVFEFPDAISYEPAVRYRVGCPVDVDVYYNDELVCRIANDIVDEDLTIIPAWVVDDVKYFVIPQNDNYRVVITARDEGTVNCSIEKGGSESPEAIYFEDISIEAGDILTSDYFEYDILEEVHLYLDDGTDVTEIPGVSLAVYNGDMINVIPYVSDEIVGYGIFPDLREVSVPLDIPCKVGYYDETSGKYIAIEPIVYISNAAFILPEGIDEVILVVKGDVDLSGEFDFFDVVTAKAMDLYPDESYSPVQLFAADVDDDGEFGFFDVILIKAADLGKTLLSW